MRALALLVLLAAAARAAEPLTLRSAVALALERSPEVAAAKARAAEAALEEPVLLANTDPYLEGGYSLTEDRLPRAQPLFEGQRAKVERWNAGLTGNTLLGTEARLSLSNERISNPTPFRAIDPSAFSRLTLDVRQRLLRYFWGRPDKARRGRARKNAAAAADRLRDAGERAAAGAARAYLDLSFAARQQKVKQASVEDAERLLGKYEEKRRYGLAEESDLMQARASLEAQRAELMAADSQLERARHALAAVLQSEEPLEAGSPEGAPAEASVAEDEALARRPDVAAARAAAESATWDARVARLDTLPDVSFVGSYGFGGLAQSRYSSSLDRMSSWDNPIYTAGAQVSVPLAWRRERLTRRAADLRLAAAQAELLRAETAARRDLRDSAEGLRLARRRLDAVRRLLDVERKKFAAEEANFKRGRSSTDLLLRFQQDIRRAEIEAARAETDEAFALVELARAQGRLLEGAALP